MQNPDEFKLLQDGIRRIGGFMIGERYTLDSAIVNASKAAYLCKLIEKGINETRHYTPDMFGELSDQVLQLPIPPKLNKLKKTHPEAFFYFNEIQSIQLEVVMSTECEIRVESVPGRPKREERSS